MLSPALAALNRDAFVADEHAASTVDLQAHRSESTLEDVDVGDAAA